MIDKEATFTKDLDPREESCPWLRWIGNTETPLFRGCPLLFPIIRGHEELHLTASTDHKDQAWDLASQHGYLLSISHRICHDSSLAFLLPFRLTISFQKVGKLSHKSTQAKSSPMLERRQEDVN